MSTGATSRVFDALLQAKERLDAQTWPAHPFLGSPQIALADDAPDEFGEIVSIAADAGEDGAITWRSLPGGRDEVFDLLFLVTTATGETDADVVIRRLKALADVVQRAFYDDTARDALPLGIAEAVKLEGIGQVTCSVTTIDRIEGYVGQSLITYRLAFRI